MTNENAQQPVQDTPQFFEAELPPGEFERILNRIEENLVFRQNLKKQSPFASQADGLLPVVSFESLGRRLAQIEALNAPYFRPQLSRGPGVIVRRVLNQVVKIFGHKQHQFNTELLVALSDMTTMFQQALAEEHQNLVTLQRQLEQLQAAYEELKASRGTLEEHSR